MASIFEDEYYDRLGRWRHEDAEWRERHMKEHPELYILQEKKRPKSEPEWGKGQERLPQVLLRHSAFPTPAVRQKPPDKAKPRHRGLVP